MTACVLMWLGVRDGVEVVMTRGHAMAGGRKNGGVCVCAALVMLGREAPAVC